MERKKLIKTIHKPLYGFHPVDAELFSSIDIWTEADIIIAFWDGSSSELDHSFRIKRDMYPDKDMFIVDYKNKKYYKYNPQYDIKEEND